MQQTTTKRKFVAVSTRLHSRIKGLASLSGKSIPGMLTEMLAAYLKSREIVLPDIKKGDGT